ncbi:MOSC domain-containing protein [Marinococcus halophilus]|uniref:MOSC domain-containing protein n=1 Tax=Marinococcus halophilus TaxID=1371 RepID=A0A510Y509_MARHA|nr:MOSC domain-containing protein [Marinococcus halophilus]OZT80362.1 MOSC domain-containing protein [Marinococcus halophilus]GEK58424.1 MOSC domain-containing protein [Marinococcus halophilus]
MNIRVMEWFTGRPEDISAEKEKPIFSAINKTKRREESLYLSETGLEGDEQGDQKNHGGAEKAVCVYPWEHYAYWSRTLEEPLPHGSFGENLTVQSGVEEDVMVGDVFRWGKAVVEISQPREPCYKIAKRHGIKKLPLYVRETGYSGYYLRVRQAGIVEKNQPLRLEARTTSLSVAEVNRITYHSEDPGEIEEALECAALSEEWKSSLHKKLNKLKNKH